MLETIGPALAFIFQSPSGQVQQEAYLDAGRAQAIDQLDFMSGKQDLDCLFLHHQLLSREMPRDPADVLDGEVLFTFHRQDRFEQLVRQCLGVNRLQKARNQSTVSRHRATNDCLDQFLLFPLRILFILFILSMLLHFNTCVFFV